MKNKIIILKPNEIPRQWYNIAADIKLNPPLGPDGKPIGPESLAPVFPMNLIEQEVSTQRWINIPEEVLNILAIWRPTPMIRAYSFEKALNTPARIYIKNESVSPPQQKRVQVNGEVLWHLQAANSDWILMFLWFVLAMTKNHSERP